MKTSTYEEYKARLVEFAKGFDTNNANEVYNYNDFADKNEKSRAYNRVHTHEFITTTVGWTQLTRKNEFNGKILVKTHNAKSGEFAYYRYYILEGTQENYKVYRVNPDDLPVKVAKRPK